MTEIPENDLAHTHDNRVALVSALTVWGQLSLEERVAIMAMVDDALTDDQVLDSTLLAVNLCGFDVDYVAPDGKTLADEAEDFLKGRAA